jgi:hypothetical protein
VLHGARPPKLPALRTGTITGLQDGRIAEAPQRHKE